MSKDNTENKKFNLPAFDIFKEEGFLEEFLLSAPNSIYVLDEEGNFLFVNNRAAEIAGYKPEEMLNENISKFVKNENLAKTLIKFRETLQAGNKVIPE